MHNDRQTIRPIVVGGDIGAYATARAFHEAYGVHTVVLAGVRVGAVADSRIVDLRIEPGLEDPQRLAATVLEVIAESPQSLHLVLGSADWLVSAITSVREKLERAGAVVPYPDQAVIQRVADKTSLLDLAREVGAAHPATITAVPAREKAPEIPFGYPVVVKPARTVAAEELDYPGKAKVHVLHDAEQFGELWSVMGTAGVEAPMLVQEFIPGPDSAMAAVNVFIDPDGRVRLAQFGRVLLEEHGPSAVGNSVAQMTMDPAGAQAQALGEVVEMLRRVGWRGFANADLKRDPDGAYRLLEINPRVGRSGFAVTASGYNVAGMYGDAFLGEGPEDGWRTGPVRQWSRNVQEQGPGGTVPVATAQHVFTVVPWQVLRRYLSAPLRAQVRRLWRSGAATNPLYYPPERHPRRWAYIAAAMVNYGRKLARYHPSRR
ncbi:MAG TPA: hypothetical protein VK063_09735 [Beutenbergiaceae bacterium]|nr:hypothetical protein [Beutenbergiaceae bacterium]